MVNIQTSGAFTGANGVRQPLLHSKKTNKLARQRAALQLLSGAGRSYPIMPCQK